MRDSVVISPKDCQGSALSLQLLPKQKFNNSKNRTDQGFFGKWFGFIGVNLYKVAELLLHSSDAKDILLVLFGIRDGREFTGPRF
jgi:hypothetical protein